MLIVVERGISLWRVCRSVTNAMNRAQLVMDTRMTNASTVMKDIISKMDSAFQNVESIHHLAILDVKVVKPALILNARHVPKILTGA